MTITKRTSIRDYPYSEIAAMVTPAYRQYPDLITQAIDKHYRTCLNYTPTTGVTRNNEIGELSRFSSKADIPSYDTMEDILKWALMSHVNNSISRLLRGYDA